MSRPPDTEPGEGATDLAPDPTPLTPTTTGPARPGYAAAPPPAPSAPPPGARPRVVMLAFSVWVSSFMAGLLAVAYSLSKLDELRGVLAADVRAQRPQIAPDALDRVVRTTINVGLAGVTGIVLAQLVLAVLVLGRHHWARVTLTALGLAGMLATLFALVTFAERTQVLLAAQAVLIVGGIVLMFQPGANTWFRGDPA
ncbi:MAG TPA: hypothetical protein VGI84_04590 [Pseudonocardiaceae bacterium]